MKIKNLAQQASSLKSNAQVREITAFLLMSRVAVPWKSYPPRISIKPDANLVSKAAYCLKFRAAPVRASKKSVLTMMLIASVTSIVA